MKLVKVKDYSSLCRDVRSNAVININQEEYNDYLARKKQILAEKEKLNDINEEINIIKHDMSDIKELLFKFIKSHADNK